MLTLLLAFGAADVDWIDESGRCPASAAQAQVAAAADGLANASIRVEVHSAGDGLNATLRLETADGVDVRALESPSCETLVEAAALVTQAAVQAAVPPPPAEPEPLPEPVEPLVEPEPVATPALAEESAITADSAEPLSVREPPPPTQDPLDLRGFVRGFGVASFGLTPRWSGGGGLALGLAGPHWTVEGFAVASAPSRTAVTPGIQAWAWSAGARGCGVLGPYGRVQPGLCAAGEVGRLRGESTGAEVINRRDHVDTWVGVSLGPSLRIFALPWLAVVVDAEALAVLRRPVFALGGENAFTAAAVSPRLSAGLEARFGGR